MNRKGFPHFNSMKRWFATGLMLLLAILSMVVSFAKADLGASGQKKLPAVDWDHATFNFAEISTAQYAVRIHQTAIAQENDSKKKAVLQSGLDEANRILDEKYQDATSYPTRLAAKKNNIATSDAKVINATPHTNPYVMAEGRVSGLRTGGNKAVVGNDVYINNKWYELNPDGWSANVYYAGSMLDDTHHGVIVQEDQANRLLRRYILDLPEELTLTGKQGTFLILKQANGSPLYFDIVTHQFALSPVGTITPLATAISPQMKQSTPQPASNNPATAYPAVP